MPFADLPDDLQMHHVIDDFTDPWSESETVILHHGNAKNLRMWYAWVPLLARDFRVVRLDSRGFGESSLPASGYRWGIDSFVSDAINLMDYLDIEQAHSLARRSVATSKWRRPPSAPCWKLAGPPSASAARVARGQQVAALMPNARFVAIPGVNRPHHSLPVKTAAIWRDFVAEVRRDGR